MVECSRCGVDIDSSQVFEVISSEGVVKVCERCVKFESGPILRRPTTYQLKAAEQTSTVYERLSNLAGLDAKDHFKKFHGRDDVGRRNAALRTNVSLREIVDKNLRERNIAKEASLASKRPKLVDNFHWMIQRARRMKKVSQEQTAKDIAESKGAIELIEKGIVPEDSYGLARKLEAYLGIKIIKEEPREQPKKEIFKLSTNDQSGKSQNTDSLIGRDIEIVDE